MKPFETVIVIRGCNKLDLLGAAVGEGKEKERERCWPVLQRSM